MRNLHSIAPIVALPGKHCSGKKKPGASIKKGGPELPGVGPYIEKVLRRWMEVPPIVAYPPAIRENFFTLTQVRSILGGRRLWSQRVKGDLQMHSVWSDGSSSIQEMAEAGEARDYGYIAITDHSKGLKIAGGIDEKQLAQQADEIAIVNESLRSADRTIHVLRSIEVNISPHGQVDMDLASLAKLDIVLGCFHSALRKKEDQTERYIAALRNSRDPHSRSSPRPDLQFSRWAECRLGKGVRRSRRTRQGS